MSDLTSGLLLGLGFCLAQFAWGFMSALLTDLADWLMDGRPCAFLAYPDAPPPTMGATPLHKS
jgi:hypothetical protein